MSNDELRVQLIAAALAGSAAPLKELRAKQEQMTQGVSAAAERVDKLVRGEANALAEAAVAIADAVLEVLARKKAPPPG
ncbi:MAG TPA: hypothetical protein VFS00_14000 [Polyangiaceae bacterium]|nr:hypothetical protein [Polyangiaceae bacterium]